MTTSFILTISGCSPVDQKAAKEADQQWIEAHGNDPKAMDERFGSDAGIACAVRADDYLRGIAQYDFAWDDDAKGYSGKFTKYSLQSPGLGMMTVVSDKAKLSNAFGAFEHVTIYCLYNAATDEVVRFASYDPYLDKLKQSDVDDNHTDMENRATPPDIIINDANDPSNSKNASNEDIPSGDVEAVNNTYPATHDLTLRAGSFVSEYYAVATQGSADAIPWMQQHYAPSVDFFGRDTNIDSIIAQKRAYLVRWPSRYYRLVPGSTVNQCDDATSVCRSTGTVQFETASPERDAHSRGSASFAITVNFSGSMPVITSEDSHVISRE